MFTRHVNPSRVISYLKVRESSSLYIYIYISFCCGLSVVLPTHLSNISIKYKWFVHIYLVSIISNTYVLHTVICLQVMIILNTWFHKNWTHGGWGWGSTHFNSSFFCAFIKYFLFFSSITAISISLSLSLSLSVCLSLCLLWLIC